MIIDNSFCSQKRSWVEIDLRKVTHNYEVYKAAQKDDREIMAVVKADAYGHGDKEIAEALSAAGVKWFAVSNIDEALHVRSVSDGEILILGYTDVSDAGKLFEENITQTILSEDYAEKLARTGIPVKCQFAIDTGMKRIGLDANNLKSTEKTIKKYAAQLNLTGIFTHLCVADTPEQRNFTEEQIRLFESVTESVSDLKLPYCHCMNSAGGLWYHSSISCFSRLGIILYGLKPDYSNTIPVGIEPVLSWKTVISMIKDVKPGDTIGYGRTFEVKQSMKIATIPTGYADGYSRLLSNKGYVLVNGCKAPIVGRICMDQMMIDVTGISNVDTETEVVLIGKCDNEMICADDLAHLYDTIGYEVICGINKRVHRVYIR